MPFARFPYKREDPQDSRRVAHCRAELQATEKRTQIGTINTKRGKRSLAGSQGKIKGLRKCAAEGDRGRWPRGPPSSPPELAARLRLDGPLIVNLGLGEPEGKRLTDVSPPMKYPLAKRLCNELYVLLAKLRMFP